MKRCVVSSILISIFLCSCSLKYSEGYNVEDSVPEFSFSDTSFTRYENKEKKLLMTASKLEQYKDGYSMYGKDVSFTVMEDNEVATEGFCSYLGLNSKAEIYELFDNISITNKKQNMKVTGKKFKWNGKTEQLISGRNDTVMIEKDGMTIHGSGFSASGVSNSFAFTSIVTGTLETKDDEASNE